MYASINIYIYLYIYRCAPVFSNIPVQRNVTKEKRIKLSSASSKRHNYLFEKSVVCQQCHVVVDARPL